MIRTKLYILIFLSTLTISSKAQYKNIRFNNITIKNGLSHDNVYTIMQDNTGYMWIGTQNGLDQYDGYNFRTFYHDSNDSCSLISANFGKLFLDSKNRIWIGTYRGGLSCYSPQERKITNYTHDPKDSTSLSRNLIRGFIEDKSGRLWVATSKGGLNLFNEKQNNFTRFQNKPNDENSICSDNVNALQIDKNGYIWLGTSSGLEKFNPETRKFTHFVHDKNNENSISSDQIQSLFIDTKGIIWVGTRDKGLVRYSEETGIFTKYQEDINNKYSIKGKRIQTIMEDSQGTLWIGTYRKGVNTFDRKTQKFTNYKNIPGNPESLSFNKIECIYEDKAQNLWIGTRGGGISIVDLKPQKFTNIEYKQKEKNFKLPHNNVVSMLAENDSIIWIGTGDGLCRYNRKTDKYTILKQTESENSLSNNRVRALTIDSEGNIWAGTYRGGVNKIKIENNKFKITRYLSRQGDSTSLISSQVNTVTQTKNGDVWIGTNAGLSILTTKNGKQSYRHFRHNKKDNSSISANYITSIFQDNEGNIWIGTSGGLNKYLKEKDAFQFYENKSSNNKNNLDNNAITSIFQDSNNNLWIGTDGGGIYTLNTKNGKFKRFKTGNVKTSNITGILEDNEGNLWASSGKGLMRINLKTKKVTIFGIEDGLEETGFNRNACTKTPEGDLFFGNISGFSIIRPSNIKLNPHKPQIVLTGFKTFNNSYFKNENSFCSEKAKDIKELNLSYQDYVFSFEFASLDFTNSTKNKYAYKMEGFDKEWIDFGTKRYAVFTSLPPGKYTFRVKGTNNDGIWSDDKTSLAIKVYIKPPFYQTPLFYAISGAFLIFIIVLIFKLRTRKLKKEKRILEEKVTERTREVEKQKSEITKQAEFLEQANVELEKLSIVARETDNAVTIMDSEGNFLWVNEGFTKMYGYDLDEFITERGENILTGKFNDDIKKTVKNCISQKKTIIASTIVTKRNNNKIWLQTVWTPIINDDGDIEKLIAIDSDISELKRAEVEITAQKDELQAMNEEINRSNEHIRSSIRYAKTIQQSILPFKERFNAFSENFIMYKPKDIVSGDFYWFYESEEYRFVATVDCTGHGVPGAFMSLIASRMLNELVNDKKIYDPKNILQKLDIYVKKALKQKETDNRDGMDVCLTRIDKNTNNKEINVVFAGAKRDLYYYIKEKDEIFIVKGTRKSVGGVFATRSNIKFENTEFSVSENDILYLASDGYIDQNNRARQRFGTRRLITVLNEIAQLSITEQEKVLEDIFNKYRENEPQRDDVTFIGLKLL